MAFNIRILMPYPDFTLDVDFALPDQGVTAIFGPSGAGKTSLLRAIAGLDKPPKGHIRFGEKIWQSADIFLPTHKRPIGYVFQEPSLFDHMTVAQNLDYGPKRIPTPMGPAERDHIIDLLGLAPLLHRRPDKLSGGEKQRVAIARALLLKPEVLLMDEPMASLDFARKNDILSFLQQVKFDLKIPLLYVSHNISEVTRLADHLVIMAQGKIDRQGRTQDILSDHKILNRMSEEPFTLLFGTVRIPRTQHHLTEVDLGDGMIRMPHQQTSKGAEIRLHLYARDVSITLTRPEQTSVLNIFDCHITALDPPTENGQCLIHLTLQHTRFQAQISAYSRDQLNLQPGDRVFAQIKAISMVH